MSRPRLLDLFCGAGGCSVGYERAGFDVVGIDINPQPNYPFKFMQRDALDFLDTGWPDWFDAIHASPPCQAYSALHGLTTSDYPALIEPVRALLRSAALPYVIENVVGAPLVNAVRLCGSAFGLRVWRHRLFETSFPPPLVPPCSHIEHPLPLDVTGTGGPSSKPRTKPGGGLSRKPASLADAREAMTEYLGGFLMAEINARRELAA